MEPSPSLTGTQLSEALTYNPESGLFRWNGGKKKIVRGQIAGTPDKDGYINIKINQRVYKAHRLACLWMNGRWPPNEVDHINGIKNDNRFCNLREATKSENMTYFWAARQSKGGVL